MILLGQTHNAVLFAWRANLLSKFVRNQKKANDLIAKNQSAFGQRDALFGKAFHTVLYRKAKHNKTLKEAQRLLSPPPKKLRRHFDVTDNAHGHGRGHHPWGWPRVPERLSTIQVCITFIVNDGKLQ